MEPSSRLPILLLLLLPLLSSAASTSRSSTPSEFIKRSCGATRYPSLCVHCLSPYSPAIRNNPKHLAQVALAVSIKRARDAHAFVTRLSRAKGVRSREAGAVRDCVENMSDTVDRLARSYRELSHSGRAGSSEFSWHMGNAQTWVSAALTDESTCVDGFAGSPVKGRVRNSVRARIVYTAQVTSNALALINKVAPADMQP
ncbi:hypothetical protein QJS04_geneDACA012354 [Acorus gramineus]|uniref:Pectinesterase inhibitor domain-containing protein n=1 Tax=Acorus gramineus TaxID=55184 RepID=A0AAV9B854_ACOGR|nr:hypothetical protein QJS04_geneDACA012354 [Acorus gramineus]